MQLNQDQENAKEIFKRFLISPDTHMSISGGAGTGKTTLINELVNCPDIRNIQNLLHGKALDWKFTATTNKAVTHLLYGSTIHSLLGLKVYDDYTSGNTVLKKTGRTSVISDSIIVVDEASMVDEKLFRFINEQTLNCKLLYVGDHCQLTPVKSTLAPVFSGTYQAHLNQIVRSQAAPAITALSQQLRKTVETKVFHPIQEVPGVIEYLSADRAEALVKEHFVDNWPQSDSRIITYSNKRVQGYNNYIRKTKGLSPMFTKGEVAVLNSAYTTGAKTIPAEAEVEILEVSPVQNSYPVPFYTATVRYKLAVYTITVAEDQQELSRLIKYTAKQKDWPVYFNYMNLYADIRPPYASTAHKAQGSTFTNVFVDLSDIGDCKSKDQLARLLYVACTRASARIYLIGKLPERLF